MANLGRRILDALENLTTLEVVTAVGPPGIVEGRVSFTLGEDARVLATRLRLLDGDTTTCIDEAFVNGPYTAVQAFHTAQIDRSLDLVKGNVAALAALYRLYRELQAGEGPGEDARRAVEAGHVVEAGPAEEAGLVVTDGEGTGSP